MFSLCELVLCTTIPAYSILGKNLADTNYNVHTCQVLELCHLQAKSYEKSGTLAETQMDVGKNSRTVLIISGHLVTIRTCTILAVLAFEL